MDRPVNHTQEPTLPNHAVQAASPATRIALAFLVGPITHRRYTVAHVKGNLSPRIGRAARMTGVSNKTLIRCDRKGWIPASGVRSRPGLRIRHFHLSTLYRSRIFTFAKAARYFGLTYEQIRWLYRSFMQTESRYASRLEKSRPFRISIFDLCRVLNRETWPSREHLRLVVHDTVRSGRNIHPGRSARRPNLLRSQVPVQYLARNRT